MRTGERWERGLQTKQYIAFGRKKNICEHCQAKETVEYLNYQLQ